jgi:hypothetical protein
LLRTTDVGRGGGESLKMASQFKPGRQFEEELSDTQSVRPFWMSKRQIGIALKVMPLVLIVWSVLMFGFKTELNPLTDEVGYHAGGVLLAGSLNNGSFFNDALNTEYFKYSGYYAFAGIVYFIFGEHPLLLRVFGFFPFFLLAVVIANISSFIAGERARVFSFLTGLLSPTLLFFSLQLYRDIYIISAVVVVLHALVVSVQLKRTIRQFITLPTLLAFVFIYLMRAPQAILTFAISIVCLLVAKALTLPEKARKRAFIVSILFIVVASYLSKDVLLDVMSYTIFEGQKGVIVINQLAELSMYSFTSVEDMLSALLDPKFFVVTIFSKLTNFMLGPHPFSDSTLSVLDLIGGFSTVTWGGYQWEDVLLVYGMQWVEHFLLLVFLLSGIRGLWMYKRNVFIIFAIWWGIYSILTIFTGNETRWGLPLMAIWCIIPALGYTWYGTRLNLLFSFKILGFFTVISVRNFGIHAPMIVVPIGLITLMVMLTASKDIEITQNE